MNGTPCHARFRLARVACAAAVLALAGCAQFGVPAVPTALARPPWPPTAVYLVYEPHTVLGLGHTGVIVPAAAPGLWLRFDQYASAELVYGDRVRAGAARFWEPVTARLAAIFGLTRERVLRRGGPSPRALRAPSEHLLPVPGLDAAAVRAAAEARHAAAAALEAAGAARYWWAFNNCQHFVRDVLRTGGAIPERYFPKHFVADTLAALPEGVSPPAAAP